LEQNDLTSLPKEYGALSSLQTLALHQNQLSTLPKELGKLTGLQWLILSKNQLTTLPKELGKLTALQTLCVDSRQLAACSKVLGVFPRSVLRVMALDQKDAVGKRREAGAARTKPNDVCPCGSGKKFKRCCR
jgi:hypothetical protein